MVQARDTRSCAGFVCDGWVSGRLSAQLCLRTRILLTQVPEEWAKAPIPRQMPCAQTPQHPQRGLAQGNQTCCLMLLPLPAGLCLLSMSDACVYGALQGALAAGGVRGKPTTRVHGEVNRLLHRFDREIGWCPSTPVMALRCLRSTWSPRLRHHTHRGDWLALGDVILPSPRLSMLWEAFHRRVVGEEWEQLR